MRAILAALVLSLLSVPARADGIRPLWQGTYWGEPGAALLAHFGTRATALPWPIDFGDSYADLVLRNVVLGGYPVVVYFQMDKGAGGLKRIQLERQRHGVSPPVFRAVLGALEAEFGAPDAQCGLDPVPASGYQAAAERVWRRDGAVIRAIFRDTTIEAFEGCLAGDPSIAGPCGLTGQLLVRISPPEREGSNCPAPVHKPPGAGR